MRRSLAGLCLLLLTAWPAEAFTTFRLGLQWLPQAQFAGYYAAFEKGFYLRRGLDVFIVHGGPEKNPLRDLVEDRVDVATAFLSDALAFRQGHGVVQLAQVVNRSGLMLVGWKERGIEKAADLHHGRVSIWPGLFRSSFLGFFREHDLFPDLVPQYGSVALFLRKGVDACAAMDYNEYHRILQAGVDPGELTSFPMREGRFGFPEDGLYCLESFYGENEEPCRAFVEASMEGWAYAREHREEVLDLVMGHARKAHVPTNRVHQRWMLEHILAAIFPGENPEGWRTGILSREDFERTVSVMREQGQLASVPAYGDFVREVAAP